MHAIDDDQCLQPSLTAGATLLVSSFPIVQTIGEWNAAQHPDCEERRPDSVCFES